MTSGSRLSLWSALSLASLAGGCIDGIVVAEQHNAASVPDAMLDDEDAAGPDAERAPELDASAPAPAPPVKDAGMMPKPMPDAGLDAGHDAGRDAGASPLDAGSTQDAGCVGRGCDAGTPPGPCAACGVVVSIRPAECDNGAPEVCWTNPYGDCTMQCPDTGSCTRDNPASCGPGRFCYFPKSDCGASTAGFCATQPSECASVDTARVCGCDGATYENPCFAAKAGTAVYAGDMARCQ